MAHEEYPVYDRLGQALIRTLGSFWYHYFGDRDQLETHYRSLGHEQGQAYLDYLEAVASVSRFDIPAFHKEDWYLWVIKESDSDQVKNIYDQEGLAYDGSVAYDSARADQFLFPLPTDGFLGPMADARFQIYNRVIYPSKTWTRGLDFDIDYEQKTIRFYEDPFESEYVAKREVVDESGNAVDREIGLWLYRGEFDLDWIWERFGFAVALRLESSQYYKDFTNALWDAYVFGSNMRSMHMAFESMFGIPLVIEPVETVERIVEEPERTLVITDKNVYEFKAGVTVIVSVGDELVAGDSMIDAIVVEDLAGNAPDVSLLSGVAMDENYLSGGYFAELVFENTEVDVEYGGLDDDGKAVVTFRIQGFPNDVDLFFEKAQEVAKATGQKTLAELLDLRDSPSSQPLPPNLSAKINPLDFALQQIMRNHLWLLKIKTSAIQDRAPGLKMLRYIRDIVPPHTSLLIFVEISADTDTIDLSFEGSESAPGVQEDPTRFNGIVPDAEEVVEYDGYDEPSYEDVVARVYRVSEVCS
jgi:hypothetical protein